MNTPAGSGRTLNVVHAVGTTVTASRILRVDRLTTGAGDGSIVGGIYRGSLPWCIGQANTGGVPYTIVLETSGTLNLAGGALPVLTGRYGTLAFHTAPAPGFQIRGSWVLKRSDLYAAHVCIRYGSNANPTDTLAISGANTPEGETRRVVLDHCLAQWGNDETLSLVGFEREVGLYNTIIAEGAGYQGGVGHMFSSLANGDDDEILYYGCLLHTAVARHPRLMTINAGMVNGISYNGRNRWIDWSANDQGVTTRAQHLSLVGQTFVDGPGNNNVKPVTAAQPITAAGSGLHLSDCAWVRAGSTLTNRADLITVSGAVANEATPVYWPAGLIAATRTSAYDIVRSFVGPRPAQRDAVITRLLTQLDARTHSPKLVVDPTGVDSTMPGTTQLVEGDWPVFAANAQAFPTTPPSGGNWNDIVTGNYTRLEAYLHTLEDQVLP
jgi:hypothetical protein